MNESPFPEVTEADVRQGREDQAKAVVQGLVFAGGVTTVFSALNAPTAVGRFIVPKVTGMKVTPTTVGPSPRFGTVTIPKLSYAMLFVPTPVGVVPAEVYGADPDYVKKTLGFRTGNKPPFLNASETRVKVFAARTAAENIMRKASGETIREPGLIYHPISGYRIDPGPIPITLAELAYLRRLPAGLHPDVPKFLAAVEGRELDFIPDTPTAAAAPLQLPSFLGGAIINGSIQPEGIQPVNDAAKRNAGNAKGINKELVHERADP